MVTFIERHWGTGKVRILAGSRCNYPQTQPPITFLMVLVGAIKNIESMKVDLSKVTNLYDKIVSIEEYYHPEKKWTNILQDGTDLKQPDIYYRELDMKVPSSGEIEFNDDVIERVVKKCIASGATMIQFSCRDKKGEECYPDYKVSELLK